MKNIIIIDNSNKNIYKNHIDDIKKENNINNIIVINDNNTIYDIVNNTTKNIIEKKNINNELCLLLKNIINKKDQKIFIYFLDIYFNDIIEYYYIYNNIFSNDIEFYVDIKNINKNNIDKIEKYELLNTFNSNNIKLSKILNQNLLYKKINFNGESNFHIGNQIEDTYGKHRYGWEYIKKFISKIENKNSKIYLDLFMEKNFLWDYDNAKIYNKSWIGFFHNPVIIDKTFKDIYNVKDIFQSEAFIKSLNNCKGIITLSNHNKDLLSSKLPKIKIFNLKHPMPNKITKFSYKNYIENKKVIHIGYWLRNFSTFHRLKTNKNIKCILSKCKKEPYHKESLSKLEHMQCNYLFDLDIKRLDYLENFEYDNLLSSSIVFLDLINPVASNTLIECIMYNTPVLINKHPSNIEYLGVDYPFYYDNIEEASKKIDDLELIKKTTDYLKNYNKDDLGITYFLKKFKSIIDYISTYQNIGFTIGKQNNEHFGKHRSGWKYVLDKINLRLQKSNIVNPLYLDTFMESTFCWGKNYENNYYDKPWACIIHNPPNIPIWFQAYQHIDVILQNKNFLKSLKYLKKIIVLSDYLKKFLEKHKIFRNLKIPIHVLYHPTEIPKIKFDYNKFLNNNEKKIVQIGWWQRVLHTIFILPNVDGYKKVALGIKEKTTKKLLKLENKFEFEENLKIIKKDVLLLDRIPNDDYDKLLSENIVFIKLYDSSANNLVIECIARNTPILINKVGGVVDYLGKDYPFYYEDYEEAVKKLKDFELIKKTTDYLKNNIEVNRKIDFDNFYYGLVKVFS